MSALQPEPAVYALATDDSDRPGAVNRERQVPISTINSDILHTAERERRQRFGHNPVPTA